MKPAGQWLVQNWERVIFSATGLFLLGAAMRFVYLENAPSAGGMFGLALLSFFYANVARFKKFKGFGIEAELWEDKKKEAEALIERLKSIVTTYSREIILGRVKAFRWGRGDWQSHWDVFDELNARHSELGQKVDLSDVKRTMDTYFLYDISGRQTNPVRIAIANARHAVTALVGDQHRREDGAIYTTPEYNEKLARLREIKERVDDPFGVCDTGNLPDVLLKMLDDAKAAFKRDFNYDMSVDPGLIAELESLKVICAARPVVVTPELIKMANREE